MARTPTGISDDGQRETDNPSPPSRLAADMATHDEPAGDIFPGLVGQADLRAYVSRLIEAAKEKGTVIPPLAIIGRSGHGKTTIASAICTAVSGEKVLKNACYTRKGSALLNLVMYLEPFHAFFLDDVHDIPNNLFQELIALLSYLREGPTQPKILSVGRKFELKPINLIVATSYPEKLPMEIRNRWEELHLERYTPQELARLAKVMGARADVIVPGTCAAMFAARCHGSPMRLESLIGGCISFSQPGKCLEVDDLERYFTLRGLDSLGLDKSHREFLRCLEDSPDEGLAAGFLANRLELPERLMKEMKETLLRLGLIRVQRGLRLTEAGRGHLQGGTDDGL